MASLGHIAMGFAVARAHEGRFNWKAAVAFSTFSLVPDLDVIAFRFGIPYAAQFGHRGATHSIAFAFLMGAAAFAVTRSWKSTVAMTVVVATHPLLDMLTDGGLGVALFWPLSLERHFFPWTPLPVAPLGSRMLSERGLHVLLVEAAAFLPFWIFSIVSPSPRGGEGRGEGKPT
jgi:inner membrane protein